MKPKLPFIQEVVHLYRKWSSFRFFRDIQYHCIYTQQDLIKIPEYLFYYPIYSACI